MSEKKYDLTQLLVCANFACEAARVAKVNSEVNWGDLECRAAAYVFTDKGLHYEVQIEEAAPDAGKFQAFVAEYLEKQGFKDVVVLTEW
jgi:hypothetical protein